MWEVSLWKMCMGMESVADTHTTKIHDDDQNNAKTNAIFIHIHTHEETNGRCEVRTMIDGTISIFAPRICICSYSSFSLCIMCVCMYVCKNIRRHHGSQHTRTYTHTHRPAAPHFIIIVIVIWIGHLARGA